MKKLYFLVIVIFAVGSVRGQDAIVNIPDPILKNLLVGSSLNFSVATDIDDSYIKIDTNNDGEIQQSEVVMVNSLNLRMKSLSSLEGISSFVNLKILLCDVNNITELNLMGMQFLKRIDCSSNDISHLDVSNMLNLEELDFSNNYSISLNVSGCVKLKELECNNNAMVTLDVSGLIDLELLKCQNNLLTSILLNGCVVLEELDCHNNALSELNLNGLVGLKKFNGNFNNLNSLSFQNMPNLTQIICQPNNLTSLVLQNLPQLRFLICNENQLTEIDLSQLPDLYVFDASNNPLVSIDFSKNTKLYSFTCESCALEALNLKNGKTHTSSFINNPMLKYICCDESEIEFIQASIDNYNYDCTVNSYCSFTPGGLFYTINGNNTFDANNNGCDASDESIPNLKFNITNGTQTGSIIANQSGEYSIPVQSGTHTITPVLENPSYYTISTTAVNVTFPTETSPFTQNFCITPNGIHPDLEVAILPTTPARPGFNANYKIILKNKGNIQQSGSVSLAYNEAVLDYISANPSFTTQAEGSLSWAFANLEPFETREINLTLNVNSPMETPAVNGDDVLTYTATITSDQTDELPLDNTFSLPQIVVNSFDPNDKTCLEGTAITPDMIGQYVHYMIRFENTGTFAAENIVVKDMIDTEKFDVSSLIALNGSHPYVTRITGNKVEFIFEGINLPFDDANNDGYVVFKIKTLPTLALGDSFSNTASIYFDYNHPIVTEPAVTTFADLDTKDFEFNSYLTIYPNPTNGILNITSKQDIEMQSISIYNVLGQMVVAVPNAKGVNSVDVSSLSTGNYFIKVISDRGTSNSKFIKQ